jgi:hypothetical protein
MGTSKKNEEEKRRCLDKRTPAQAAFEKMQEKRVRRGEPEAPGRRGTESGGRNPRPGGPSPGKRWTPGLGFQFCDSLAPRASVSPSVGVRIVLASTFVLWWN